MPTKNSRSGTKDYKERMECCAQSDIKIAFGKHRLNAFGDDIPKCIFCCDSSSTRRYINYNDVTQWNTFQCGHYEAALSCSHNCSSLTSGGTVLYQAYCKIFF